MKRLLITVLFIFSCSWTLASSEQSKDDIQWQQVSNDRFGFILSVPKHFTFLPPPQNDDGRTLRYKDIEIRYFGGHNALFTDSDNPLKEEYDFISSIYLERSYEITYTLLKDNFFVISGYDDKNYIFYQKTIYDKDKDIFVSIVATYPQKDKKYMNNILKKMIKDITVLK